MLFKKECIFLTVSRQNQEGTNSFQSLEDRKKIHEAKITLYRVCHVLSKKKLGLSRRRINHIYTNLNKLQSFPL